MKRTALLLQVSSAGLIAAVGLTHLTGRGVWTDRADREEPRVVHGPPTPVVTGEPIRPIDPELDLDEQVVDLGRRLFHDPGLSVDGKVSCATCHDLDRAGVDNKPVSAGVGGQVGDRNSPTVLNSSLNFRQFWDGRAETLEEQVGGPLTHPKEMGATWEGILDYLSNDSGYRESFASIWREGVSEENVRKAIATFERSLTTPGSRFDRYLQGEAEAISELEREGYELFLELGCISCHQGVNVGGNLFQRMGVRSNFFEDRGGVTVSDLGRYNQTERESDAYKFKVPSLRNVTLTAPYFHDGSVASLEQAIRIMALYQLGLNIDNDQVDRIAAFLGALEAPTRE